MTTVQLLLSVYLSPERVGSAALRNHISVFLSEERVIPTSSPMRVQVTVKMWHNSDLMEEIAAATPEDDYGDCSEHLIDYLRSDIRGYLENPQCEILDTHRIMKAAHPEVGTLGEAAKTEEVFKELREFADLLDAISTIEHQYELQWIVT